METAIGTVFRVKLQGVLLWICLECTLGFGLRLKWGIWVYVDVFGRK